MASIHFKLADRVFSNSHLYDQLYIDIFIAGVSEGAKCWRGECKKEPMHSWSYNDLLVVGEVFLVSYAKVM